MLRTPSLLAAITEANSCDFSSTPLFIMKAARKEFFRTFAANFENEII